MTTRAQSPFSQFRDFLSYLSTVTGDLSNITAPPFLLSPRSVTEMPATWAERQDLFLGPAHEEDPEARALMVLKGFLCSLKRQGYYSAVPPPMSSASSSISSTPRSSASLSRSSSSESESDSIQSSPPSSPTPSTAGSARKEPLGGAKKPLNAFLGELFLAKFLPIPSSPSSRRQSRSADSISSLPSSDSYNNNDYDDDDLTHIIVEQVSHHPPTTACFTYNKAHGMSSEGYVAPEMSFSASSGVRVSQIGHAIIRDAKHGESHLMTFPTLLIRGLLTGRPYPELDGACYISSSSGYLSTIEFSGKGTFGMGTKNSFTARLCNVREDGEDSTSAKQKKQKQQQQPIYEITGQWTGKITIKSAASKTVVEEFDVDDVPRTEARCAPLSQQSPWESRRAWHDVIQGINAGNMEAIARRKEQIEKAQRRMRATERDAGLEWPRMFFHNNKLQVADGDDNNNDSSNGEFSRNAAEYKLLARAIPDEALRSVDPKRTGGVWSFVGIRTAESILKDRVHFRSVEPTGELVAR